MLEVVVFACVGLVAVVVRSIWAGGLEGGRYGLGDGEGNVGCSVIQADKYVGLRSLILWTDGGDLETTIRATSVGLLRGLVACGKHEATHLKTLGVVTLLRVRYKSQKERDFE